jgi:Bacterial regulatory helix-turn-helix protein, lysR family
MRRPPRRRVADRVEPPIAWINAFVFSRSSVPAKQRYFPCSVPAHLSREDASQIFEILRLLPGLRLAPPCIFRKSPCIFQIAGRQVRPRLHPQPRSRVCECHLEMQSARLRHSARAVGHAVRRVEDRLGTPLFARTTRSVSLTEAGTRFIASVEPALTDIGKTVEGLTAERNERQPRRPVAEIVCGEVSRSQRRTQLGCVIFRRTRLGLRHFAFGCVKHFTQWHRATALVPDMLAARWGATS